jgi:hypothetical protein
LSSLLVEEIDLGDGNVRQVVSGLAKYCSPDDLTVSSLQQEITQFVFKYFCLLKLFVVLYYAKTT